MKKSTVTLVMLLILTCFGLVNVETTYQAFPHQEPTTERQRQHSRLYEEYRTGRKLRDVLAGQPQGPIRIRVHTPLQGGDPNMPPLNLRGFLRNITCSADAVVIGRVTNKTSLLTENEEFVFTDYEMTVAEVLRNNTAAPIQPNSNITITRPGGTIQHSGRTVETLDRSFRVLEIGQQYVLFLRYLPLTDSYQALNSTSSFLLRNNRVFKLTDERITGNLDGIEAASFTDELRAVISSGCDNSNIGGIR